MSFSTLKKRSGSSLENLVKEAEKLNKQGPGADERFWKPELDKSGNGYAVIRFLPAPDGESYRGQRFIPTHFKVQEDGTSRTP